MLIIVLGLIALMLGLGALYFREEIKIWFKKHWKQTVAVTAASGMAMTGIILLDGGTKIGDTTEIYYFDSYGAGVNMANLYDSDDTTYYRFISFGTSYTEKILLNSTNYTSGHSSGDIISKVEVRMKGSAINSGDTTLTMAYNGTNSTTTHTKSWTSVTEWSSWYDVTNEENMPSTWVWTDIADATIWIMFDNCPDRNRVYGYMVQIRVTYGTNYAPTFTLHEPTNNEVYADYNTAINVSINDTDANQLDSRWYWHQEGFADDFALFASDDNHYNETFEYTNDNFTSATKYNFNISTSDGTVTSDSTTWAITTTPYENNTEHTFDNRWYDDLNTTTYITSVNLTHSELDNGYIKNNNYIEKDNVPGDEWLDVYYQYRTKLNIHEPESGYIMSLQVINGSFNDNSPLEEKLYINDLLEYTDFSDVHFTESDGVTVLNFTRFDIQENDSARFFIELTGNNKEIWVYYGCTNQITLEHNEVSNLLLYENFTSDSEWTWTTAGGTTASVTDGILEMEGSTSGEQSQMVYGWTDMDRAVMNLTVYISANVDGNPALNIRVTDDQEGIPSNDDNYVGLIDNIGGANFWLRNHPTSDNDEEQETTYDDDPNYNLMWWRMNGFGTEAPGAYISWVDWTEIFDVFSLYLIGGDGSNLDIDYIYVKENKNTIYWTSFNNLTQSIISKNITQSGYLWTSMSAKFSSSFVSDVDEDLYFTVSAIDPVTGYTLQTFTNDIFSSECSIKSIVNFDNDTIKLKFVPNGEYTLEKFCIDWTSRPYVSHQYPLDENLTETGPVNLSIFVTEPDGDSMTVKFYDAQGTVISTQSGITNASEEYINVHYDWDCGPGLHYWNVSITGGGEVTNLPHRWFVVNHTARHDFIDDFISLTKSNGMTKDSAGSGWYNYSSASNYLHYFISKPSTMQWHKFNVEGSGVHNGNWYTIIDRNNNQVVLSACDGDMEDLSGIYSDMIVVRSSNIASGTNIDAYNLTWKGNITNPFPLDNAQHILTGTDYLTCVLGSDTWNISLYKNSTKELISYATGTGSGLKKCPSYDALYFEFGSDFYWNVTTLTNGIYYNKTYSFHTFNGSGFIYKDHVLPTSESINSLDDLSKHGLYVDNDKYIYVIDDEGMYDDYLGIYKFENETLNEKFAENVWVEYQTTNFEGDMVYSNGLDGGNFVHIMAAVTPLGGRQNQYLFMYTPYNETNNELIFQNHTIIGDAGSRSFDIGVARNGTSDIVFNTYQIGSGGATSIEVHETYYNPISGKEEYSYKDNISGFYDDITVINNLDGIYLIGATTHEQDNDAPSLNITLFSYNKTGTHEIVLEDTTNASRFSGSYWNTNPQYYDIQDDEHYFYGITNTTMDIYSYSYVAPNFVLNREYEETASCQGECNGNTKSIFTYGDETFIGTDEGGLSTYIYEGGDFIPQTGGNMIHNDELVKELFTSRPNWIFIAAEEGGLHAYGYELLRIAPPTINLNATGNHSKEDIASSDEIIRYINHSYNNETFCNVSANVEVPQERFIGRYYMTSDDNLFIETGNMSDGDTDESQYIYDDEYNNSMIATLWNCTYTGNYNHIKCYMIGTGIYSIEVSYAIYENDDTGEFDKPGNLIGFTETISPGASDDALEHVGYLYYPTASRCWFDANIKYDDEGNLMNFVSLVHGTKYWIVATTYDSPYWPYPATYFTEFNYGEEFDGMCVDSITQEKREYYGTWVNEGQDDDGAAAFWGSYYQLNDWANISGIQYDPPVTYAHASSTDAYVDISYPEHDYDYHWTREQVLSYNEKFHDFHRWIINTGNVSFKHTLSLYDSSGDGWEGAFCELFLDGAEVFSSDLTIAAGQSWNNITFYPHYENGMTVKFTGAGSSNDLECRYRILDADDNVIFSEGDGAAVPGNVVGADPRIIGYQDIPIPWDCMNASYIDGIDEHNITLRVRIHNESGTANDWIAYQYLANSTGLYTDLYNVTGVEPKFYEEQIVWECHEGMEDVYWIMANDNGDTSYIVTSHSNLSTDNSEDMMYSDLVDIDYRWEEYDDAHFSCIYAIADEVYNDVPAVNIPRVTIDWMNDTTWVTLNMTNVDDTDLWYYNMTGLTNPNIWHSFNITAYDIYDDNAVYEHFRWIDQGVSMSNVFKCGVPVDVDSDDDMYTEDYTVYLWNASYDNTPHIYGDNEGREDSLRHEQGVDGTSEDTGYFNFTDPTDEWQSRHCIAFAGGWFDGIITIKNNISLNNMYAHLYMGHGGDMNQSNIHWGRGYTSYDEWWLPESGRGEMHTQEWNDYDAKCKINLSDLFWTGEYDWYGNKKYVDRPGSYDSYLVGETIDLSMMKDQTYDSNSIYKWFFGMDYDGSLKLFSGSEGAHFISNISFPSFIIFNIPDAIIDGTDNNVTDSDSDTVSDWREIYTYYTHPFKVDTDNDGVNDNLDRAPNHYLKTIDIELSNEYPRNETSANINPNFQIDVYDCNDQYVDIYWRWYNSTAGTWHTFEKDLNTQVFDVATVYADIGTNMSENGVTYTWCVNVTDGIYWTNATYTFTTTYAETLRNDGIDYFTWVGENMSAWHVNNTYLTGLDESVEYISIWNRSTWESGTDNWGNVWMRWQPYYGDGTGTNWTVHTFDVIRIHLNDVGTQQILVDQNPNMDYYLDRNTTLHNNATNYGYNYGAAIIQDFSSNLSTINTTVGLVYTNSWAEVVALWDDTDEENPQWRLWFAGWNWNTNHDVSPWDVLYWKIGATAKWFNTGDF